MSHLAFLLDTSCLMQAFEMLDVDEDGELSIDEFTAGLSQLQDFHGLSVKVCFVIFTLFDT